LSVLQLRTSPLMFSVSSRTVHGLMDVLILPLLWALDLFVSWDGNSDSEWVSAETVPVIATWLMCH
jgi:hypothetical protein